MKDKNDKKSNKMGRPTKYRKEFCDMMIEFFSIDPTYEQEVTYTNKKGETWSKMEEKANALPTFERFAHSIGVEDKTLENWSKAKKEDGSLKYPDFFRSYMHAKQLQRDILVQNALLGRYNPAYAIFLSKNVTDMREKVEVPVDGEGNAVPFVAGFTILNPKGSDDEPTSDKTND